MFCTTERYYLVFWPSEETYSVVQQSKIVEPKDPSIDETVKVKEGGKVFSGKVAALGTKADVEAHLSEVEGNNTDESQLETNGELTYMHTCMYSKCVHG